MDRLYQIICTFPANTPIAAPVSFPWALEDNELVYVDIKIPPGPSGQMGFRILWAQQQIVPWANNSYLITDDEKIHVDCNTYMTQTGVVIQGYNTDIFAHSIYVRGLIRTMTGQQVTTANELTGNVALPAALDQSETSGANSLVGTASSLSDAQAAEDASLGIDTSSLGDQSELDTLPPIASDVSQAEASNVVTPIVTVPFGPRVIKTDVKIATVRHINTARSYVKRA